VVIKKSMKIKIIRKFNQQA